MILSFLSVFLYVSLCIYSICNLSACICIAWPCVSLLSWFIIFNSSISACSYLIYPCNLGTSAICLERCATSASCCCSSESYFSWSFFSWYYALAFYCSYKSARAFSYESLNVSYCTYSLSGTSWLFTNFCNLSTWLVSDCCLCCMRFVCSTRSSRCSASCWF